MHLLPPKATAGKFRLEFLSFYMGQRHNITGSFFSARCVTRMGGMRKGVFWKTVTELGKGHWPASFSHQKCSWLDIQTYGQLQIQAANDMLFFSFRPLFAALIKLYLHLQSFSSWHVQFCLFKFFHASRKITGLPYYTC